MSKNESNISRYSRFIEIFLQILPNEAVNFVKNYTQNGREGYKLSINLLKHGKIEEVELILDKFENSLNFHREGTLKCQALRLKNKKFDELRKLASAKLFLLHTSSRWFKGAIDDMKSVTQAKCLIAFLTAKTNYKEKIFIFFPDTNKSQQKLLLSTLIKRYIKERDWEDLKYIKLYYDHPNTMDNMKYHIIDELYKACQ